MYKQVSWPVVLLAFLLLGGAIFGTYAYLLRRPPAPPDVAREIPPKKPGDDKPATPPPGVRIPGTVPR